MLALSLPLVSALWTWTLIFAITLWSRCYYYTHFTDERLRRNSWNTFHIYCVLYPCESPVVWGWEVWHKREKLRENSRTQLLKRTPASLPSGLSLFTFSVTYLWFLPMGGVGFNNMVLIPHLAFCQNLSRGEQESKDWLLLIAERRASWPLLELHLEYSACEGCSVLAWWCWVPCDVFNQELEPLSGEGSRERVWEVLHENLWKGFRNSHTQNKDCPHQPTNCIFLSHLHLMLPSLNFRLPVSFLGIFLLFLSQGFLVVHIN